MVLSDRWTSRSGIEAVLCSLVESGDKILVPSFGRFGYLLTEIAERCGGEVRLIECEWGEVFDPEQVIKEMHRMKPKLVAMVHGETSTGRMQPLKEIGYACREMDCLFVVDAVATVGGTEVKTDEWYIDALITGTQKCISVPSGMAPITYNERVEKIILERKSIEKGLVSVTKSSNGKQNRRIRSNYFDLSQIQDYWSPARLNHHTEATTMLYALYEGLRIILEEGLEERIKRHQLHEKALVAGLKEMGMTLFGNDNCKLPMVTCINIPVGIDGEAVRSMLLDEFSIEIASSFGLLHGKIWRVGTMGYSARKKNVLQTLAGLEAVLLRHGVKVNLGAALQGALDIYAKEPVQSIKAIG